MNQLKIKALAIAMSLFLVSPAMPLLAAGNGGEDPIEEASTVRRMVAINFPQDEETKVTLRGTPDYAGAKAEAKVEREDGRTKVELKAEGVKPVRRGGSDVSTYMVWAATPEGEIDKLGELVLDDHKGELERSTSLETFALFVTAEPDTTVAVPSGPSVLESITSDNDEAEIQVFEMGKTTAADTSHTVLTVNIPDDEKVDLKLGGTARLSNASGEAEIERKDNTSRITIELDDMKPARLFGGDFNTYIAWAISPQGQAINLGTIVLEDDEAKIRATTSLREFALIVTAEPHFMVELPSRFLVLENRRPDDKDLQVGSAKILYPADERVYDYSRVTLTNIQDVETYEPSHLAEARTAMEFAEETGAERYASEELRFAQESLRKAEEAATLGTSDVEQVRLAREAVRRAVAAQTKATEGMFQASLEQERLKNENRARGLESQIKESQDNAERERLRAEEAEARLEMERMAAKQTDEQLKAARRDAERARLEAEIAREQARGMVSDTESRYRELLLELRERQDEVKRAEDAMREAELRQQAVEQQARSAASDQSGAAQGERRDQSSEQQPSEDQANGPRSQLQSSRAESAEARQELERARTQLSRIEQQAEQYRQEIMAEREAREAAERQAEQAQEQLRESREQAQTAQQEIERTQKETERLKQQSHQTRQQLREALGQVAEVRETVTGLVVNLPEVLFEVDRAELKPQAGVMLESIAKTLQSTEGTQITIEGHTDSTGSTEYNRELSRKRASAVRDFLLSQGVPPETIIDARGVGEVDPIASNDTERGRQMNRRVEIIVEQLPEMPSAAE